MKPETVVLDTPLDRLHWLVFENEDPVLGPKRFFDIFENAGHHTFADELLHASEGWITTVEREGHSAVVFGDIPGAMATTGGTALMREGAVVARDLLVIKWLVAGEGFILPSLCELSQNTLHPFCQATLATEEDDYYLFGTASLSSGIHSGPVWRFQRGGCVVQGYTLQLGACPEEQAKFEVYLFSWKHSSNCTQTA